MLVYLVVSQGKGENIMKYKGLRYFISMFMMMFVICAGTAFAWTPPVGVPMPEFGISDSHVMYRGAQFNFGAGPQAYRDAGNGPYTHYIDNTSPSATDTGNPFGTASMPRATIPANLPAGSVVEIHGGPYDFKNLADKLAIYGYGTAQKPIFVRGISSMKRPVFNRGVLVFGSYVILENLEFNNVGISLRQYEPQDMHHIAFRYLEMKGNGIATGANNSLIDIGIWQVQSPNTIDNVVIFSNVMHDYGDWLSEVENDKLAVSVSGYDMSNIWIVDNEMYHMGGDAVRVGNNSGWVPPSTSRNVYIGRNSMHDNRENAVDVKVIENIVITQNSMYSFRPSSSDPGAAIVVHYNPSNIWIAFNDIHESFDAITCTGVVDLYVIGNLIHNVTNGIRFWGNGQIYIVNNTIVDFGNGVINVGGEGNPHPLIGNIIAEAKNPAAGYHVDYDIVALAANSAMEYNLFYQSGTPFQIRWGGPKYSTVQAFIAGSGKGAGCVEGDPLFAFAKGRNYHLTNKLGKKSPAIDAGIDAGYAALFYSRFGVSLDADLDGGIRPLDGNSDSIAVYDIGCYEFGNTVPTYLDQPKNLRLKSSD